MCLQHSSCVFFCIVCQRNHEFLDMNLGIHSFSIWLKSSRRHVLTDSIDVGEYGRRHVHILITKLHTAFERSTTDNADMREANWWWPFSLNIFVCPQSFNFRWFFYESISYQICIKHTDSFFLFWIVYCHWVVKKKSIPWKFIFPI